MSAAGSAREFRDRGWRMAGAPQLDEEGGHFIYYAQDGEAYLVDEDDEADIYQDCPDFIKLLVSQWCAKSYAQLVAEHGLP